MFLHVIRWKGWFNRVAVQKIGLAAYHTEDSPVEIFVPNRGKKYIDLQRCRMYVKGRIVEADRRVLTQSEKTEIINLTFWSLWSRIKVYANTKLVTLHDSPTIAWHGNSGASRNRSYSRVKSTREMTTYRPTVSSERPHLPFLNQEIKNFFNVQKYLIFFTLAYYIELSNNIGARYKVQSWENARLL